ncbi:hypothetical protein [Pseudalkalibacillus salsuginis]|uniref:hypothetical protein n=1 Tax=Pseudalkalibacillus salsuginis TaxID=2910972 RepID=UPI001F3899EA|nr:hypothetical protein [Pseudalkalibacillus salsuginis]MCF6408169.1 hypothetical protein [Pseudalkalibacillus salsuginis]
MYERHHDIERVTKAMNALEGLNEPCYEGVCERIRDQLENAIAFESGYHRDMSKYSSMNGTMNEN